MLPSTFPNRTQAYFVFEILEKFTNLKPLGDLQSEDGYDAVVSKEGTLSYIADALRCYYNDGEIDSKWIPVSGGMRRMNRKN